MKILKIAFFILGSCFCGVRCIVCRLGLWRSEWRCFSCSEQIDRSGAFALISKRRVDLLKMILIKSSGPLGHGGALPLESIPVADQ